MTDLLLLYPDRDLDMVAVASLGMSSGGGEMNYAYIGGHITKLLSQGIYGAMKKGRRAFDSVRDWCTDRFDDIEPEFWWNLGQQDKPFWGSDTWNPYLVPSGYVNRFDSAADVTCILVGAMLAKLILGKVGIGNIAKFSGGLYGTLAKARWKSELADSLADIEVAMGDPDRTSRMSRTNSLRMNSSHDMIRGLTEGWAVNSRQPLIQMLQQLKATQAAEEIEL